MKINITSTDLHVDFELLVSILVSHCLLVIYCIIVKYSSELYILNLMLHLVLLYHKSEENIVVLFHNINFNIISL